MAPIQIVHSFLPGFAKGACVEKPATCQLAAVLRQLVSVKPDWLFHQIVPQLARTDQCRHYRPRHQDAHDVAGTLAADMPTLLSTTWSKVW
jgi:hypothetical protein